MAATPPPQEEELDLQPCEHQAGGHFSSGKDAATFVDGGGRFYKAIQDNVRGSREAAVYELVFNGADDQPSSTKEELQQLRAFLPRYYGMVSSGDRRLLALEDGCYGYRKPCVLDAKMGFSTVYDWADDKYKEKNRGKDEATTQASLGYRVTGFKVYQRDKGEYFAADRLYGKSITDATMPDALAKFASNGALTPRDIYGGPSGALAKLRPLEEWFSRQRSLCFFAASVIIMYEGEATTADEADVRVSFIDFAHTYPSPGGQPDANVYGGMKSLLGLLEKLAESPTA